MVCVCKGGGKQYLSYVEEQKRQLGKSFGEVNLGSAHRASSEIKVEMNETI